MSATSITWQILVRAGEGKYEPCGTGTEPSTADEVARTMRSDQEEFSGRESEEKMKGAYL